MATIAATAIYTRLREVLDHGHGSVRVVPASAMTIGDYGSLPEDTKAQRARIKTRFDIDLGWGPAVSPVSSIGSRVIRSIQVRIITTHTLEDGALTDAIYAVRGAALETADLVEQALTYVGNVGATSAGVSTGICSGALIRDGNTRITREDFDKRILVIEQPFRGFISTTLTTT